MRSSYHKVGRPSLVTNQPFSPSAMPSGSRVLHRADGLTVALSEDGGDEPDSLSEDLGSDFSFTTSDSPAPTEASATPPRMDSSTSAPRLRTSSSAKSWVESQVAFGEHRRMTRRQACDVPHKSKGKVPQRTRSGSYRRRSLETDIVRRREESLLAIISQHPIIEGQPNVMLGDRTDQRRADPVGLDVTMEELALFDAMAAHASSTYQRAQYGNQTGLFSTRPGFALLEDDEEATAREVYHAMQDEQQALHAADPRATVGTTARGLVMSPPNIPLYLEGSETTESVRREDEAMVDVWRYIYSVIRQSPSQRMCAYVQVSAGDSREVLRQVTENEMSCMLHRRGTEWWVAVVDQEDSAFLEAFVERRMREVAVDQGGRQVLKLPWGKDPLVVDEAVRVATDSARTSGSAPQWPMQYTTGTIHFLVAWLDLEW